MWVFFLLLAVMLFVFQEVLFRLVFPVPEIANFNRGNYSMMVSGTSEGENWTLSNEAYTWASDPDNAEFVHHLNLYGFRDQTWAVKGSKRAMFVGDSFVEGFMANDDETIPTGFEVAARAAGEPIETMNLGTGAAGIADYLAVIRDAVPIFKPDIVILVLYANDFPAEQDVGRHLDSGQAAIHSNDWLPRLYAVVSQLMRSERVATRWSKPPFMFLPASDSSRSPLHDEDFVANVSEFVTPEILSDMQTGRFNPFVINEYTNYATYLPIPAKIEGVIERTRNFVEAHGGQLMLVHIPYRSQVSDHYLDYSRQFDINKQPVSLMSEDYQVHAGFLDTECQRLEIPCLDMTAILRQREADGERMYWNYDEHMKGSTYLLTGAEIFRVWRHQRVKDEQ
jgi:hypothetical protein